MMLATLCLASTSALAADKPKITFYGLILEYSPTQKHVHPY